MFVSLGASGDFNTFALEISIARELDTEEATKRNMSVLLKTYEYSNQVSILKYLIAIAHTDTKHIWIFLLCISSNRTHRALFSMKLGITSIEKFIPMKNIQVGF